MNKKTQLIEAAKCLESPAHFIREFCYIYDAVEKDWIKFDLWPEQVETLDLFIYHQLIIVLKARQLGLTWLVLCFNLWLMLFAPITTSLIFSRRDDEAVYLLGQERMRGVYKRLPAWLKKGYRFLADSGHEWRLSNESSARAFPTTAGDSYTVSLVVVDEADLVPDLNALMRAVKPTIDAGGKLILVSRSDKEKPQSEFKNIYKAAKLGENDWVCMFLPWHVRPGRDQAWYDAQARDIFARTFSFDDLHEQYPATDTEALASKTLDKRIPGPWIEQCYTELTPLPFLPVKAPSIPGLEVFFPPKPGHAYVIGIDPAEGNPTSDDSAFVVLDKSTGEEVAKLKAKLQPSTLADYADQTGKWYNRAALMVERNNHGHAVLLWLEDHSQLQRLEGHDKKEGWLSSTRGKTLLYTYSADAFRFRETRLHSFDTFTQLASIDGSTLRAPEGELDDLADAYSLGLAAIALNPKPVPLSAQETLLLPASVWS